MAQTASPGLIDAIRQHAYPLTTSADYDPLMDLIGDARFVLLGEASHGTHDFYQERAEITKRLIQEKGFTAVAVEADWPDAYRVNRFVRGQSDDLSPRQALDGFRRFPTWMWRNTEVVSFLGWLRQYNDDLPRTGQPVGFYGLDLYSLFTSIETVLDYLNTVDPDAAQRAHYRYSCFDHFGEDSQHYGYAASFDLSQSCEDEVLAQLIDLQRHLAEYRERDGRFAADETFFIEQNARLVKNAEEYYRAMFQGRISAWNLRDRHMVETLGQLVNHLGHQSALPKIVVWEHNSHLGDARATELGRMGEWNVGQLTRQRYGQDAVLVGFTTYTGTVTAASNWNGPAEMKRVRPALPGSYEALFHEAQIPRFLLPLQTQNTAVKGLNDARLERAIGVIYRPETERSSHYFTACLPKQFDAVIHLDDTRAVEPLDRWQPTDTEAPETYPSAL